MKTLLVPRRPLLATTSVIVVGFVAEGAGLLDLPDAHQARCTGRIVVLVPDRLDESVRVAVAVRAGRRLGHAVHVDSVARHLALVQLVVVEDGLEMEAKYQNQFPQYFN